MDRGWKGGCQHAVIPDGLGEFGKHPCGSSLWTQVKTWLSPVGPLAEIGSPAAREEPGVSQQESLSHPTFKLLLHSLRIPRASKSHKYTGNGFGSRLATAFAMSGSSIATLESSDKKCNLVMGLHQSYKERSRARVVVPSLKMTFGLVAAERSPRALGTHSLIFSDLIGVVYIISKVYPGYLNG